MVSTVNKHDARRFIAWKESADWNPCIWGEFKVSSGVLSGVNEIGVGGKAMVLNKFEF